MSAVGIFLYFFGIFLVPVLLFLFLLSGVIKEPWIRVPLAFGVFGAIINFLPSTGHHIPAWRLKENQQKRSLESIGLAWLSYKSDKEYDGDQEHAIPKRLSQLLPEYLGFRDAKLFFDERARDFDALCKKANADPMEVDRNGIFEYFGGRTGGMVAASKMPIEKVRGSKVELIRVVLETNGDRISVNSIPEEEYQRRLTGKMPEIR